jgi:hypothetical protein
MGHEPDTVCPWPQDPARDPQRLALQVLTDDVGSVAHRRRLAREAAEIAREKVAQRVFEMQTQNGRGDVVDPSPGRPDRPKPRSSRVRAVLAFGDSMAAFVKSDDFGARRHWRYRGQ